MADGSTRGGFADFSFPANQSQEQKAYGRRNMLRHEDFRDEPAIVDIASQQKGTVSRSKSNPRDTSNKVHFSDHILCSPADSDVSWPHCPESGCEVCDVYVDSLWSLRDPIASWPHSLEAIDMDGECPGSPLGLSDSWPRCTKRGYEGCDLGEDLFCRPLDPSASFPDCFNSGYAAFDTREKYFRRPLDFAESWFDRPKLDNKACEVPDSPRRRCRSVLRGSSQVRPPQTSGAPDSSTGWRAGPTRSRASTVAKADLRVPVAPSTPKPKNMFVHAHRELRRQASMGNYILWAHDVTDGDICEESVAVP